MNASEHCFKLLMQLIPRAFSRALLRAGNNIEARIAMIAITTNSSINVNLIRRERRFLMANPP